MKTKQIIKFIAKKLLEYIVVIIIFLTIAYFVFPRKNNSDQTKEKSSKIQDKIKLESVEKRDEYLKLSPKFQTYFKSNPELLKDLLRSCSTYKNIEEWLEFGIKPDESEFVSWIQLVKSKLASPDSPFEYQYPEIVKEKENIDDLRKEWQEWRTENEPIFKTLYLVFHKKSRHFFT